MDYLATVFGKYRGKTTVTSPRMETPKLKIQRLRNKVRVSNDNNSFIFELSEKQTEEITNWIQQVNIGHRISWDTWQLNNRESVMMFILKWG